MVTLGLNMQVIKVGIINKKRGKDMATWTYETMATPIIPNTIMEKGYADGTHKIYRIKPIANYVLHDNTLDIPEINEETMEETIKFGYSPYGFYKSCGANYDFTTHTVTDENGNTYTAYGNRDFFAVPESDVPADQIFGVDEPEHEVM